MDKYDHSVKVAAAQVAPVFLNRQQTVDKACDVIAEAGKQNAKFVVFPEAFIPGYPDWVWVVPNSKAPLLNTLYTELLENAVTIPDETTQQLGEAAKKAGIYVAIGMHEKNAEASNASLYNTLLFLDDKGNILGKRRKLMPTGGERLVWAQGDGSTLQVFETAIGRVAGLICWENYMPLARQTIYAAGAQILASPTWDKSDGWLLSMRHIAREGGLFVISCCMALKTKDIPDRYEFKKLYPEGRDWVNTGQSCIIDPRGEIIAGPVASKEEILYAKLDMSLIASAKRMFDAAGHYARPDVFKLTVNREPNAMID